MINNVQIMLPACRGRQSHPRVFDPAQIFLFWQAGRENLQNAPKRATETQTYSPGAEGQRGSHRDACEGLGFGMLPNQGVIGLEEGRQERDSFSREKGAGRGGKCCRDAGLHLRAEIRAWMDKRDTNGAGHHTSPFIVRKRGV